MKLNKKNIEKLTVLKIDKFEDANTCEVIASKLLTVYSNNHQLIATGFGASGRKYALICDDKDTLRPVRVCSLV